ncbi:hypothetical protein HMF7854_14150 [Sphingomonas ginkgonis]|uniref:Capsule biosynthesis protein n=1 Tax=Sphingomonas ginkgonis TaxID=2315330 RepID=A0A3R9YNL2_9SPHN|nr:DUF6356 family protein [Sphingomonas ginkgonis]RST31851.1 hypothetical protein HMF7854_14150 [Sphingomonas ginkgonis]
MSRKASSWDKLFVAHPRTLGMSWAGHGAGAVAIGCRMIGAGAACLVHAVVPGWFTETAGRTVMSLHRHMTQRRAGASDPQAWPEYEI